MERRERKRGRERKEEREKRRGREKGESSSLFFKLVHQIQQFPCFVAVGTFLDLFFSMILLKC